MQVTTHLFNTVQLYSSADFWFNNGHRLPHTNNEQKYCISSKFHPNNSSCWFLCIYSQNKIHSLQLKLMCRRTAKIRSTTRNQLPTFPKDIEITFMYRYLRKH